MRTPSQQMLAQFVRRGVSFANQVRLGIKTKSPESEKACRARADRRLKTRLCAQHLDGESCLYGAYCFNAHSLAELVPPVHFDLASRLSKKAQSPTTTHEHVLEAKILRTFRRRKGFKSILDDFRGLNACALAVHNAVEYQRSTLLTEQMVEKCVVEVNAWALEHLWFLSPEQLWAVKQVLGKRYNPDTDVIRLVRRNYHPYTEILNVDTVYDSTIRLLHNVCTLVREKYPVPYTDQENLAPWPPFEAGHYKFTFWQDQSIESYTCPFEFEGNPIRLDKRKVNFYPSFEFEAIPFPSEECRFKPEPELEFSGNSPAHPDLDEPFRVLKEARVKAMAMARLPLEKPKSRRFRFV